MTQGPPALLPSPSPPRLRHLRWEGQAQPPWGQGPEGQPQGPPMLRLPPRAVWAPPWAQRQCPPHGRPRPPRRPFPSWLRWRGSQAAACRVWASRSRGLYRQGQPRPQPRIPSCGPGREAEAGNSSGEGRQGSLIHHPLGPPWPGRRCPGEGKAQAGETGHGQAPCQGSGPRTAAPSVERAGSSCAGLRGATRAQGSSGRGADSGNHLLGEPPSLAPATASPGAISCHCGGRETGNREAGVGPWKPQTRTRQGPEALGPLRGVVAGPLWACHGADGRLPARGTGRGGRRSAGAQGCSALQSWLRSPGKALGPESLSVRGGGAANYGTRSARSIVGGKVGPLGGRADDVPRGGSGAGGRGPVSAGGRTLRGSVSRPPFHDFPFCLFHKRCACRCSWLCG